MRETDPAVARRLPPRALAPIVVATIATAGCGGPQSEEVRRGEARLEEGRALVRQGRLEAATEALEEAVFARPDDAEARFLLAGVLAERRMGYRALDELRAAERLRPGHGPQQILLGRLLTDLGRLDEARVTLGEAVEEWPASAEGQLAMGLLELRLGRVVEAEHRLSEALRLDPELRGAHEAAGRALLRLGRVEEAVARFEEAARGGDCDDLALGGLGVALVVDGRPRQGWTAFGDAADCSGPSRQAPWMAGRSLAAAAGGRIEQALEVLDEVEGFFPPVVEAAIRATLEDSQGRGHARACSAGEEACALANERLWAGAILLFVVGAPDAAARELERSLSQFEGDPAAHWMLAEALAEQDQLDGARLEADRAAPWEPSEAVRSALEALGRRLEGEGSR